MKISALSIFLASLFLYEQLMAQIVIKPNGASSAPYTDLPTPLPDAYSSTVNINYVRTLQPNKPITDPNLITTNLSPVDVQQQTQYIDGLGRLLQTVIKGVTPAMKDMVAPVIYDEFGRESFQYLPYAATANDGYFKENPFVEQQSFMQRQYVGQGEQFCLPVTCEPWRCPHRCQPRIRKSEEERQD